MKTIYLDTDFKCHAQNTGTFNPIETNFFDGKCDAFIEGWRCVPDDKEWVRSDGVVFTGEMIAPWKPYSELDSAQRAYEEQLLADYESALAEIEAALGV